ncbi:leucine-rich repeat-containing protein 27-like [Echeneis naucrates]|uniref:leucine-rich repeat-containing protein 27-like n=1 Tax=Echeneis naucrates TaxID=173247 RepID=UPI001113C64B|nr:leucine-rich repeat-containing protein 27 [Echeneis naucrates]
MSSPEEKEETSDRQRSYLSGNSVDKPQTSCFLPGDAEPQELDDHYSTETLCLSKTKLKHVSESIFKNRTLKYLYLEGNQISKIPGSLFISLPNLQWLDLRNNQIVSLPAEIGLHRSLRTLLLEGNPISELPPELGKLVTLKGLNLRNCPITFPPQDIVHQGVQGILQYLRSVMANRQVSAWKASPELPVVEKLQLSELMGSSVEEQDESVDEDELQRFNQLKQQMILLDKDDLGSIAQGDRTSHLPVIKTKKAASKAGIIPELHLFDTQHWKRPEEKTQAAMQELKEKQAVLEQRRKSQEALRAWRTQDKKISAHRQRKKEKHKQSVEAEADEEKRSDTPPRPHMPIAEYDKTRSDQELERQIRARVEKIQERHRNPRGTATEQMAAAEQDVEEMRKLQAQLLERKKNRGQDAENCFTLFTGDTWPSFLDK